ncbi:molybdopterin converting factor subunit 1 [Sandaracinus amylolyticus]|uniref:molybdopterin converting factor subunit 1 n=1 Tax=Sandaracinus amylolyticus TaxID=927083 RepID=UPI001F4159DF|nr:molybdopterin converting factor subunit 1 [Sandaracinus amylolyticus]UJR86118.1 Hypothetical protein I5071_81990 [Sandaracinus amylolyticus]
MRVTVLYFAGARDLAGRGEERVDVPDDVRTVGALAAWIEQRVPALAGRGASLRWARNEAFASMHDAIEEDDVIAIIPPVAGGCA